MEHLQGHDPSEVFDVLADIWLGCTVYNITLNPICGAKRASKILKKM
jgi:hypothetical protein